MINLCFIGAHDWEEVESITQWNLLSKVLRELKIKKDYKKYCDSAQKGVSRYLDNYNFLKSGMYRAKFFTKKICLYCGEKIDEFYEEELNLKILLCKYLSFELLVSNNKIHHIQSLYWYSDCLDIPIKIGLNQIVDKNRDEIMELIKEKYFELEKKLHNRKNKAQELWGSIN